MLKLALINRFVWKIIYKTNDDILKPEGFLYLCNKFLLQLNVLIFKPVVFKFSLCYFCLDVSYLVKKQNNV